MNVGVCVWKMCLFSGRWVNNQIIGAARELFQPVCFTSDKIIVFSFCFGFGIGAYGALSLYTE